MPVFAYPNCHNDLTGECQTRKRQRKEENGGEEIDSDIEEPHFRRGD